MAGIPKVKIQFDADLDGLKKGTSDADKEVGGFADRVGEFGRKAAAAFAVAGAAALAYAGKLAVDGVKAAIEDEQAQLKLARALESATGATNAQIKAVEDQILQTSLATGVADDKLRPALQRLALATGDTEKAQKLLNLALDVSAATGKPLEAVSNALGKAYEGNTTALAKLQVGLSSAELKTMDFQTASQTLSDLFGGAASANADTYQGRIDRIKIAFDETKESIGAALLPILEKLLEFITESVLPVFQKLSDGLSGSGEGILGRFTAIVDYIRGFVAPIFEAVRAAFVKIGDAIRNQQPAFKEIIDTFAEIFKWLNQYIIPILKTQFVAAIQTFATAAATAIKVVVPIIETVLNTVKTVINGIISVINTAIDIYNKANNLFGGKDIAKITKVGAGASTGSNTVSSASLPSGVVTGNAAAITASSSAATSTIGSAVASAVGSAVGSVVGATAAKAVAELPKTLIEQITEENALKLIPDTVFDPSAVRRGEEKSLMPEIPAVSTFDPANFRRRDEIGNTINVTVNGAVDPESTARQIVNILNESQARGTIGGGGIFGLEVAI